jgi:hypothetical protein
MTTYAKRKLKYSRNENFNLLHYVEWDRIVTLTGHTSGLRVTLSYLLFGATFLLKMTDLQNVSFMSLDESIGKIEVDPKKEASVVEVFSRCS